MVQNRLKVLWGLFFALFSNLFVKKVVQDLTSGGYKGDSEEWKQWIAETVQNAEYDCNIAPTGKEKVFTLSTCVGDGSSPYRLVIHAVTVAQKEVANAEKEAS